MRFLYGVCSTTYVKGIYVCQLIDILISIDGGFMELDAIYLLYKRWLISLFEFDANSIIFS